MKKLDPDTLPETFEIPAMFDAHVHFREREALYVLVPQTARVCDRALVMPNTSTPITDGRLAKTYRECIVQVAEEAGFPDFNPLMTLYLEPDTPYRTIQEAVRLCGKHLAGVKIYPKGGTTNSDKGIPIDWLYKPGVQDHVNSMPPWLRDTLKAIAGEGLVLNVHGEDPEQELLEREGKFMWSGFAEWYLETHKGARLVLEHVSTDSGLDLVDRLAKKGHQIAASLTLHHCYDTVDNAYRQCHNCCWPPPNYRRHRDAVRAKAQCAFTVNPTDALVFLGSDTAAHTVASKERAVCACGDYTAPLLAEKLAEMFAEPSWIDMGRTLPSHERRMTVFTSTNAAAFYNVEGSGRKIHLVKRPWTVPQRMHGVVPWQAGKEVLYRVEGEPRWLKTGDWL